MGRPAPGAALCLAGAVLALARAQFLPPGTTDVPVQRPGDCNQTGPATYVYRMSEQPPNDLFPGVCTNLGGAEVHFNDPCQWAHGQAQMTAAHFTKMCKGATRMIHWHNQADEWGFVSKGQLMTFVASPDGLPWPSSTNILQPRGVWYFPSGWLHGLMCVTPEEEGGCEFFIVFASPQAAEPNGHNLDTTLAQADSGTAAAALDISTATYDASRPAFGRAERSIHYSISNMTAPIVTAVAPGACDPECPPIVETVAAPAAVQREVEQQVRLPDTPGLALFRIRTDQFPFSRTMSQERAELAPGASRPLVWATADALLVVVSGTVTVSLEGGVLGKESHLPFANETIGKGDVAYLPNGRAFWFVEASGTSPAETITVFNVGNWKNIELRQAVSQMPHMVVMSNLHQAHFAQPASSAPLHV